MLDEGDPYPLQQGQAPFYCLFDRYGLIALCESFAS
jgi:hypothetical protein